MERLNPEAEPGARFKYSDVNFILLGKVVETVSGQTLDVFTQKRIFEPLGMKDSGFRPNDDLKKRCAPTEKRDGKWMVGEVHDPRAWALGGVAGHAGLFSTADDLAIFARMLLHQGKHGGQPFLKAETVRELTAPRKVASTKSPAYRTLGWDMLTSYSSNRGERFTPGVSFGHTGFTGTSIWIDPPSQTVVILLTNRVHPDGKGNVAKLRGKVATLAAESLGIAAP